MRSRIRRLALFTSIAALALGVPAAASAATCPCSLFGPLDTPTLPDAGDAASIEVGMRFSAETDGFVTGARFYKGGGNTGLHTGALWTSGGTLLATTTFTGEGASGWQAAAFDAPVPVTAGTTYVVSYHAPLGHYAATLGYFGTPHDKAPLHAPADGSGGANGVYTYGAGTSFPTSTFNSANYWVDVTWDTTAADTTAPTVTATTPTDGAATASRRDVVRASFSERVDPATVTAATVELRTAGGALVPAAVTYDAATRSAVLDPTGTLVATQAYTATVHGGSTGAVVRDLAGNALAATRTWSFTTAGADPEDGPGGPVLLVTDSTRPYSTYYAEILRAEGLNLFTTIDVADLSATVLAEHEVAIIGELPLTSGQASLLTTWVTGGGNLVTMRPDAQLAGLAGLGTPSGMLANAYLKVDTTTAPGAGIVGQTMQFHGTADRYPSSSATTVATLFAGASTATTDPAVTLRSVGSAGGQVAAFTFDLARSVVQTRQGNPAWIGQERDGQSPVRSDDLFFGAKVGDVQPDWIDLDKVAIPQADEQQRLLANVLTTLTSDAAPLPRFWYLPDSRKAAIVHALDDHNTANGTTATLEQFKAESPAGCSVAAWECFRATSWFYTGIPLTDAQAAAYRAEGFDLGSHINSGCNDYTPTGLASSFASELANFRAAYPSLPPQRGNRTHCIPWTDWDTVPKVSLATGIRIDMGYYYWPGSWVQDRPGFFTGSGMPMRYAETSGRLVDVYQLTNQLVNENGQSYPAATNALLDRALGAEGYYAVLGVHDDFSGGSGFSDGILASAKARGVAVVSADQMLTWIDGRNASAMRDLTWTNGELAFTSAPGAGATGLTGMVPTESSSGPLRALTRDGAPVTFSTRVVKGVSYAMFAATTGRFIASYGAPEVSMFGNATPANPADTDTGSVELGMRFRSDVAGTVTGVRFYKGPGNTGTHVGNLWSAGGTRLATVTFADESASGWQQARFASPVAIAANTSYVISYLAPAGHYAYTAGGFASAVDAAPLHAPADTAGARTGVYRYGATSGFPTSTFGATNYWVDVLVRPGSGGANPPVDPPAGGACPCSVFGAAATPTNASESDSAAVSLGMRFRSDVDGAVTGVRFFKGAGNTGTHVGKLWTSTGTLLGTVTFGTESASGWQTASFAAPLAVTAGTTYVVSYLAPNGHYAADSGAFATTGVDAAPLHAPASVTGAANGLYRYGAAGAFPNASYQATNYWVDVVFAPTVSTDTTAPTITARTPAAGATGVAAGANAVATFSEALATASVGGSTVELRGADGALVPAAVSLGSGGTVVTVDPTGTFAQGATYTVTVRGGASGARVTDLAGNALATTATWSFTTAAATPATSTSLFAATSVPTNAAADDPGAVELGMRFRSDVAGTVTGVRFYKGAGNTGVHTGHLWSGSGALLGTATFANEGATGWQLATFDTPAAVSANTTYVVSYHAPVGHYAADYEGFTTSIDAAPLHGLASGVDGTNGVFGYGAAGTFPTGSWRSTNYWVDVAFTAGA